MLIAMFAVYVDMNIHMLKSIGRYQFSGHVRCW